MRIEPGQFRIRNGRYELRVTQPKEESAYIDGLELLAIAHSSEHLVFPEERLALSGTPPT